MTPQIEPVLLNNVRVHLIKCMRNLQYCQLHYLESSQQQRSISPVKRSLACENQVKRSIAFKQARPLRNQISRGNALRPRAIEIQSGEKLGMTGAVEGSRRTRQ